MIDYDYNYNILQPYYDYNYNHTGNTMQTGKKKTILPRSPWDCLGGKNDGHKMILASS